MKKLLIALFSVFCMIDASAKEPLSYEIDPVATANAQWEVGEVIASWVLEVDEESDSGIMSRRFLGVTLEGYYLVQEFYESGEKLTDPYTFLDIDSALNSIPYWGVVGRFKMWHSNGKPWTEVYIVDEKPSGVGFTWDANGDLNIWALKQRS